MVRALLALLSLLSRGLLLGQTSPFDLLITGARVIDGSGGPWFYAGVGIRGDSIVAVGPLAGADASVRIDGRGLVVAPGFIDIHWHGRRGIFAVPTAENYLREGFTTEFLWYWPQDVLANCGVWNRGWGRDLHVARRLRVAVAALRGLRHGGLYSPGVRRAQGDGLPHASSTTM